MNHLERFIANMEYQPTDWVPNWELGVWPQTRDRWEAEGLDGTSLHWRWFPGEAGLGMDPKEFISFDGAPLPRFEYEVLEEDERTFTFRDEKGMIRKGLKEGMSHGGRMSMDEFIDFPVHNWDEWQEVKKRFDPASPQRLEPNWDVTRVAGWRARAHPLIFGPNCTTLGFYWWARELMGTEGVSYGWYDQPKLMHDICEHHADFLIEGARPVLEKTTVDYICLNEDMP